MLQRAGYLEVHEGHRPEDAGSGSATGYAVGDPARLYRAWRREARGTREYRPSEPDNGYYGRPTVEI